MKNGPEDDIMPKILECDYLMDEVNLKDSMKHQTAEERRKQNRGLSMSERSLYTNK